MFNQQYRIRNLIKFVKQLIRNENCELTERYVAENTTSVYDFQNAINARQYHTEQLISGTDSQYSVSVTCSDIKKGLICTLTLDPTQYFFQIHECIETWCKSELVRQPSRGVLLSSLRSPLLSWGAGSYHDDKLARADVCSSKLMTFIQAAHEVVLTSVFAHRLVGYINVCRPEVVCGCLPSVICFMKRNIF